MVRGFLRSTGSFFVCAWLVLSGGSTPGVAVMVTLDAAKDNMVGDNNPTFSNGAGRRLCVGVTGEPGLRRALIQFDLAGSSIPAGSTINGVTLELQLNRAAPSAVPSTFDLHRLLADWGESSSAATNGECKGAGAENGDATWLHTFADPADFAGSPQWSAPGGDFAASPSASASIDDAAGVKSWSAAQMAADVQGWLDNPASNFGWLVKRTDETGSMNAVRFDSRQSNQSANRPRLLVDYTAPGATGACCSPGQSCQELSATDCVNLGGNFQGAGTDCSPNPCPPDPTGACCAPLGTCTEVTEPTCDSQGGSYQGDGESCAVASCPVLLEPFVDPLPIPSVATPVTGSSGGAASYEIAIREVQQLLHRDLPPTTVWGYGDGPGGATFPGPTIEASTGAPVTVTWINDLRDTSAPGDPKPYRSDHFLPVDGLGPDPGCRIHGAEDLPKTVVHLHGGHVPADVDGYPEFTFLPGNQAVYTYPNQQIPSTLWYHDHSLGITRLNVMMGLAGFYLIRDAFEQSLNLPAGEFEIPLAIQDRSFNQDGSLQYPAAWQDHFFGDTILVNGRVWPFLEVKQGKYRFRLLNGSGSRTYTLGLDRLDLAGGLDLPFVQIGTEGGLLELPHTTNEITISPGERVDVVIDFELIPAGTEIVLTNSAPAPYPGATGIGVIPEVMKFVVLNQAGFTTALPASLRPIELLDETQAIKVRDFVLDKEPNACGSIWTINGLTWDDITEYPQLGTTEIWRFINPRNVMHPMHMHLEMFQILDREPIGGGAPVPPHPSEAGWKDTARAESQMITRVIAKFKDYAGLFAYHCHILEHEDHEMMRQFRAVEAIGLSVGGSQLSWSTHPGATGYDIVRGELVELRATGGNFALSSVTVQCLADDQAGTTLADTDPPSASGQGFWYLIRPVDPGGNGTYDSGISSQVDQRDDEIAGSGNDCP